jgi:hypothetical protein
VEQKVYHVLLEGRTVGPYDRRTIVGMRIKKALTSDHVLVGTDGSQLTVGDLIGRRPAVQFNPERSGSYSIVQATFAGSLLQVQGKGVDIPGFKGEVECRVQGDVLRIAGRVRSVFGWKEDRVKLTLKDVVHARVSGTVVDMWLRPDTAADAPLQRVSLEMFTPETAGDLVEWLPAATAWKGPETDSRVVTTDARLLWVATAGLAAVLLLGMVIVIALMQPRLH